MIQIISNKMVSH